MTVMNSEARKRDEALERAPRLVAEHQRRREVAQQALAAIYSGAGWLEADALLDQIDTLGARLEVTP